jgi:hypothetical protein
MAMSEKLTAAIEELVEHLRQQLQEVADTKRTINALRRKIGEQAMFDDVEGENLNVRSAALKPDQFYGKPLATAAQEYLDARRQACTADEIVPRAAVEEFGEEPSEVSPKELAIAEQLVGSLSADWDPDRYKDTYRERVLDLVKAKAAGHEIVEHAEAEPAARVDDLMAALEASLAAATKQATAKKAPAKKAAAKKAPAKKAAAKKGGKK